jgi:hypothetical protein
MPIERVSLPEPVERAVWVLLEQGFVTVSERFGGMGGAQLILSGAVATNAGDQTAWVEIAGDRGHWSITLRFQVDGVAVTPNLWEAYLDGHEVRDPDISVDATFLTSRLTEAALAAARDPGLEPRLYANGREYMRRRLGLKGSGAE